MSTGQRHSRVIWHQRYSQSCRRSNYAVCPFTITPPTRINNAMVNIGEDYPVTELGCVCITAHHWPSALTRARFWIRVARRKIWIIGKRNRDPAPSWVLTREWDDKFGTLKLKEQHRQSFLAGVICDHIPLTLPTDEWDEKSWSRPYMDWGPRYGVGEDDQWPPGSNQQLYLYQSATSPTSNINQEFSSSDACDVGLERFASALLQHRHCSKMDQKHIVKWDCILLQQSLLVGLGITLFCSLNSLIT